MDDQITEDEIRAMEDHEAHVEAQRQLRVSPETHKIATEFVDSLHGLFGSLEELAHASRPMSEGEWLNISNLIGDLHKFKESLEKTQVVQETRRHANASIVHRTKLSKSDKLQDPRYAMCPKCKRVMTKIYLASKQHRDGDICRHISDYGHVVSKNIAIKKEQVSGLRLTISKKPILGGYSILDRCILLADEKFITPARSEEALKAELNWRRADDGTWTWYNGRKRQLSE